jgi:glycosyltransferase involved in cell wall biosynthesis
MHLVLLHGYLLQGTGSNIYVANIAKAWQNQGHGVSVVCQDRKAGELPFVQEFIGPHDKLPDDPPKPGTIRVVVPDISNLLPVYVFDRYDGFDVKIIPEMTPEEIQTHIEMTASTLRDVACQGADRILANHAIFGPVIAKRALQNLEVPFDVKIHGSAVEYTLVPNPHLMDYAFEGLKAAKRVVVGTKYVRDRVLEVFGNGQPTGKLANQLTIVPPGMDPALFKLSQDPQESQQQFMDKVRQRLQQNDKGRHYQKMPEFKSRPGSDLHHSLVKLGETYDQRVTDMDLPEKWQPLEDDEPVIMYFGKFLAAKGVGEILVAIPKVLAIIPRARFIFVGFGSYREHMEAMIQALGQGDLEAFTAFARAGEFVEDIEFKKWFRILEPQERKRIVITGILDHETLSELLPLASLAVVPSKGPEAFGMVAVEAMASGVLPLCTYHTGLRDVVDEVAAALPELADLIKLERHKFIDRLPEKIRAALNFLYPHGYRNQTMRRKVGKQLRRISIEKFSWEGISKRLLQ